MVKRTKNMVFVELTNKEADAILEKERKKNPGWTEEMIIEQAVRAMVRKELRVMMARSKACP